MIDLRSDTVTRPTAPMRQAMMEAPVGDDVFAEDPSINALENYGAALFGMEAALYCPSGTMTNQIALKVHTQPGQEIIAHELSHILNYEGGGAAFNSGCQVRTVSGPQGQMKADQVAAAIQNPEDIHAAPSRLVVAENTTNKGGGACYDLADLAAIAALCRENHLAFHLDGARLWNALIARDQEPKAYGELFDSISLCLSKGLGAPVGSLLLGSRAFIREARRVRKRFGGGMRQAGMLAAAAHYALENHRERLREDHQKAQELRQALESCSWVERIEPVETNIVIFYLKAHKEAAAFSAHLREADILHTQMGQGKLRFVTHLDVSKADIDQVGEVLKKL
ncbi:MAG: GntG family PLP-dependent aldolase [Schleiferiaceae bacterium]|nr:GntG family PLP-dependent aldolase [Schleiferiaceae bacterium]